MNEEDLGLLESVDLDAAEPEKDPLGEAPPAEPDPLTTSPEWPAFVMRHFAGDELDRDGRPRVHGLRRVARLLMGPVLESESDVVQSPQYVARESGGGTAPAVPAVARHRLKVLVYRLEHGMPAAYPVTFTEVADVYFGNCDPEFARHATAVAATRAEARALRKLLGLKVIAAEEATAVPSFESAVDGLVTPAQLAFFNTVCHRLDIDAVRFVNSGSRQYKSVRDVPYATAELMAEHLNAYQTDPDRIPPGIRGYKPNWLN